MRNKILLASSLALFSLVAACADNDSATGSDQPSGGDAQVNGGDASADQSAEAATAAEGGASAEAAVGTEGGDAAGEAASAVDGAADGAATDGAASADATADGGDAASSADGGDAASSADGGDAATSADGGAATSADGGDGATSTPVPPGGDGGLILGLGDAGTPDGTFQLKNPVGTNLLSFSDVQPICAAVTTTPAGTYVMTCAERPLSGSCRSVKVTFNGLPTTNAVYTVVAKAAPAANEAVVVYQESIDCTLANTNGWSQAQPGGDLTVTERGDTGFRFTLHDVALGPVPVGSTVTNQNAKGTFTLAGSALTSFPYGSAL